MGSNTSATIFPEFTSGSSFSQTSSPAPVSLSLAYESRLWLSELSPRDRSVSAESVDSLSVGYERIDMDSGCCGVIVEMLRDFKGDF
jgi:hypothetical protein